MSSRFAQLRRACLAFPGAQADRKWGNVDTMLVRRKMFAVFILDEQQKPVDFWFNAGNDRFLELTDQPGFRPAPYMGRWHWVSTRTPQTMTLPVWQPLLRASWERVVRKLPKYQQSELGVEPTATRRHARGTIR
jgi:predicted DNA-binding protein (MmcQ/YjbR family)